jgi:hypothetical protein
MRGHRSSMEDHGSPSGRPYAPTSDREELGQGHSGPMRFRQDSYLNDIGIETHVYVRRSRRGRNQGAPRHLLTPAWRSHASKVDVDFSHVDFSPRSPLMPDVVCSRS